jgi:N-acetylmuramoyl-L-alanine amidase
MIIRRSQRAMKNIKLYMMLYVFCFLWVPCISSAEDIVEVRGLRHWTAPGYIRVVIDMSGPVEFTKGNLSNPERLFFDFKNAKIVKGSQTNFPVGDKLLKSIRIGQFNAATVRVVFDLESSDYEFKIFNLEDPARFVIDISAKGGSDNKQEIKTEMKKNELQEQRPAVPSEPKFVQRKIVLDAGHGGHDPGAVGPGGLYEKNVVLDIALKARDIMKKEYPLYDVVLTRDKDVFIPLDKRTAIANKVNADLFVSIHANASPNRQARGMETYLLNWTDDEEALKVAARENAISVKQMKQAQSELSVILASLERESKRDDSVKLSGYIQNSLVSSIRPQYPKVLNLGVKQALFYVLVGAKMPSTLVEVSFISNKEEEKLLSDDAYREKLAASIAAGIHKYFSSVPAQKTVVYKKESPADDINSDKPASSSRVKYIRKTTKR